MAVSLKLTDIVDDIESLVIEGVTVVSLDGISASWAGKPFVLYPNPEGFITNFSLEFPSVLQGGNSPVDILYTLNYRFLSTQVGDMATLPVAYTKMVDKLTAVLNKLIETDSPYNGTVEMVVSGVTVGAREDPAGNMYDGADIALRIKEMQNL